MRKWGADRQSGLQEVTQNTSDIIGLGVHRHGSESWQSLGFILVDDGLAI